MRKKLVAGQAVGLCRVWKKYRGNETLCGKPATHFVTYFQDGNGGKGCCDKHLAQAIQDVLNEPTAGLSNMVRVTPYWRNPKA